MAMIAFRDRPIHQKLMIAIAGTSMAAVLVASLTFVGYGWLSMRERVAESVTALTRTLAINLTAALSFNDASAADELLQALQAEREVSAACVYRASPEGDSALFARYSRDGGRVCPAEVSSRENLEHGSTLELTMPVVLGDEFLGVMYVQRELSDLRKATGLYIFVAVVVVGASAVFALLFSALLQRIIAGPILQLLDTAGRVSSQKDYSIRARAGNRDEVGSLINGFNDMLAQIERRDDALAQTHRELERRVVEANRANEVLAETLDRLKRTQEQLVNTEKMASLGGLVAGIAHEINTPVGVGVTAASTLQANAESLKQKYDAGDLTDSGLRNFINQANQTTTIILNNLNRAAQLIHSFKQVAVDQSSSELRRFTVKDYVDEILMSLRPKLKKTRLVVEVSCDNGLSIYSYPGALSQILTNLVMNSLVHAYDPDQEGHLRIAVSREEGRIVVRYSDDGRGIPTEHLKRVFDPFFTTKRGQGGSGLGMHIVYNLVTQQLGGTVALDSAPGKGTTVTIVFPERQEVSYEPVRLRHG